MLKRDRRQSKIWSRKKNRRTISVPIFFFRSLFCRRCDGISIRRGPRVRQLRGYIDAFVASRRNRTLPLQRLRSLPQDERNEPSFDKTFQKTCKFKYLLIAARYKLRKMFMFIF